VYCIKIHKSQGTTIDEPYTIYDLDFIRSVDICRELIYVALTRTTNKDYINFHLNKEQQITIDETFLEHKITGYVKQDKGKDR